MGQDTLISLESQYQTTLTNYTAAYATYASLLGTQSSYIIVGVGTNGLLYSANGLNEPFTSVPDNGYNIIGLCTLPNNAGIMCSAGTTTATGLFTKPTYNAPSWTSVGYGSPTSITFTPDGTLICVGLGNANLYYINNFLTSPTGWTLGNTYSNITGITCAPDGTLIAVISSNLYTKSCYDLNGPWAGPIANSSGVTNITIAPDGTLLGLGAKGCIWYKESYKNLTAPWVQSSAKSCGNMISITCVPAPNNITTSTNMRTIPSKTFTTTTIIANPVVASSAACVTQCINNSCAGATYNSTNGICSIYDAPASTSTYGTAGLILTDASSNFNAIVPEITYSLLTLQAYNNELISLNSKMLAQVKTIDISSSNLTTNQTQLNRTNNALLLERDKLAGLISQYGYLDTNYNETAVVVTQSYYSYILWFIILLSVIGLTIKLLLFPDSKNNLISIIIFIVIFIICVQYLQNVKISLPTTFEI